MPVHRLSFTREPAAIEREVFGAQTELLISAHAPYADLQQKGKCSSESKEGEEVLYIRLTPKLYMQFIVCGSNVQPHGESAKPAKEVPTYTNHTTCVCIP
jgi:hypothetical protein